MSFICSGDFNKSRDCALLPCSNLPGTSLKIIRKQFIEGTFTCLVLCDIFLRAREFLGYGVAELAGLRHRVEQERTKGGRGQGTQFRDKQNFPFVGEGVEDSPARHKRTVFADGGRSVERKILAGSGDDGQHRSHAVELAIDSAKDLSQLGGGEVGARLSGEAAVSPRAERKPLEDVVDGGVIRSVGRGEEVTRSQRL